ncbi:hypothetical protein CEXT_373251 [Caerostris extrusa]|uniref:Uncharacterized protein n=1 Tax=Caerostris extrusa TaxID=172846 RepID=A0AAV4UBH3_CAEEX|nr:hypothetical protein CEXT_373251 [Caerostris extrusa]
MKGSPNTKGEAGRTILSYSKSMKGECLSQYCDDVIEQQRSVSVTPIKLFTLKLSDPRPTAERKKKKKKKPSSDAFSKHKSVFCMITAAHIRHNLNWHAVILA